MLRIIFKFIKTKSTPKKTIILEITNAVKQVEGEIIQIHYDTSFFGNIILLAKKGDKIYKYVVDRSEIYFNNQIICNDSYCREENKEPYQKLIEIIISTIS